MKHRDPKIVFMLAMRTASSKWKNICLMYGRNTGKTMTLKTWIKNNA